MRLVIILFVNIFFIQKATAQFFFHHTVGAGASTVDVIPDAVDWTNIQKDSRCGSPVEGNTQTIQGISVPIDLKVENPSVQTEYRINGGLWTALADAGTTNINSISSGTTLQFQANMGALPSTITIKNASNGDAVLDTFQITESSHHLPPVCH